MVDFTPSNGRYQTVLWKDDGTFKDTRRKVVGNYFTVYNLTQLDNGQYSMKDKNGLTLSSTYLDVIGKLPIQRVKYYSTLLKYLKYYTCHFFSCACFALFDRLVHCFALGCFVFFFVVFFQNLLMHICRNPLYHDHIDLWLHEQRLQANRKH